MYKKGPRKPGRESLKTILILVLTVILTSSLFAPQAEAQGISVMVNGKKIKTGIIMDKGRILISYRDLAEEMDADVSWDSASRSVTIEREKTKIKLVVGSRSAYKNEVKVSLDAPGRIYNSKFYAPLRFVVESLGARVTWDPVRMQASIDDSYCPLCVSL